MAAPWLRGPHQGRGGLAGGLRSGPIVALVLALAVIGWQSIEVSESFQRFWSSPLWIVPNVAWPGLFGLLGFYLACTTERRGPLQSLIALVPLAAIPLLLTILGTALILGPATTTKSLADYFADVEFWNYLLNIIGWPHFTLPGVFEFNNMTGIVNEAMWAVPCAALTAVVALLGARSGSRIARYLVLAIFAGLTACGLMDMLSIFDAGDATASALAAALAGQAGILVHRFGNRLRLNWPVIPACAALLVVIAGAGRGGRLAEPVWLQIIAIPSVMLAIAVGSWRLPLNRLSVVSLPYVVAALMVAFPVQQLVSSSGTGAVENLLFALPLMGILSVLVMQLSRLAAKAVFPVTDDPLVINFQGWRRPKLRSWLRKRRKELPPLLLLFSALIAATLAVLAMTLFAMQRNPWEN